MDDVSFQFSFLVMMKVIYRFCNVILNYYYRGAQVSDCGEYVLVVTHQECRDNLLYFTKCKGSESITGQFDLTQVVYKFEHDFQYITHLRH